MAATSGSNQGESNEAQSSASPSPERARQPERAYHILLAEDNPGDVFLIRDALESERLQVDITVKQDGEEMLALLTAIEAGQAPCPDLILMDLNLPRYNGVFLLERIRESGICSEVPVIIVTSSGSQKDRQMASRLKVSDYFRKPTDYDEFMRLGGIVRELLRA